MHDVRDTGGSEPQTADTQVIGPSPGLVLSTAAVLLVACAMAYLGIGISIALALSGLEAGEGPSAFLSTFIYFLVAYTAPAVMGIRFARIRGWGLLRALRFTAAASLAANVVLSPFGIDALSM